MDIIQALRSGKQIRRPIAKHIGSGRNGWLGNDYVITLLTQNTNSSIFPELHTTQLINKSDLLADDWEYRKDDNFNDR